MVSNVPYVMESPTEWQRLERKTVSAETLRQLDMVGLRPGMRALDAGCGTGAVARVMAHQVTRAGAVLALDRSAERLQHAKHLAVDEGLSHLAFVHREIDEPPPANDRESFDFVWSRFVFEYLPQPARTLRNLIQYAKVGGTVVVGDLDCNGLIHYPIAPELERGLDVLVKSLAGFYDPYTGRKLFHLLREAGLAQLQVEVSPYHLYPGAAPDDAIDNWSEKFRVLRPTVVNSFESEAEYDRFAKLFIDHLKDPAVFSYTTLVLVAGRKLPPAD